MMISTDYEKFSVSAVLKKKSKKVLQNLLICGTIEK